ncbi:filamentous hemagglutinin N-terminal domain-containing protein [Mitsuaria sp. TWR114]|uniref:two-partner secretion domain-containing protein n=1 Tax=Mitsuaria sp. TWR114 TaxID=2601731 RepID=UPI0011BFBF45|nr:filamentous hemagglutinin N-terminal domain-containing protein [Mitsuaria sp. TWR114]TXD99469.1 filamentous hemagglutinin N-terminal domain-containing protein [Mitsuaria sp. TWR114]
MAAAMRSLESPSTPPRRGFSTGREMNAGALNHVFRLVWSDHAGSYVPVPEFGRARGKRSSVASAAMRCAIAALALGGASAGAAGLPTGGQITQGSATLTQSGNTLLIQQSTPKLATNWQSFNIAPGSTVQFQQPSAASIALNRVTGGDVSLIQGALKSNGQVFLLNPNGVLFSSTARWTWAG